MGEVREAGFASAADSEVNDNDNDVAEIGELNANRQEIDSQEECFAAANPQPQRKKRKKASKSSTATQRAECLTKLQQKQEDTMARFLGASTKSMSRTGSTLVKFFCKLQNFSQEERQRTTRMIAT